MDGTEFPASWIDRSHHLLFSCKFSASAQHGGTWFPLTVMANLLYCLCLSFWPPVRLAAHHMLPGNTGDLVSQCHCNQFWSLPLKEFEKPSRRMLTSACSDMLKKSSSTNHQYASQHLIASTRDHTRPGLARGRMIFRCQPDPGCKVTARFKHSRVRGLHH